MDDEIALCLSPQSFHNIHKDGDLFNNINKQFWECWLPGAFAWGYIACTGTNFCIRARALCHCGWFPDYTITEDYGERQGGLRCVVRSSAVAARRIHA